jgi:tetratricopeptide (TPR) repeat protein
MKHFFNFFLAAVMTAAFCGCSKPTPAKALSRVKDAAVAGNWRDAYNQCSKLEKSSPENEKVLLMLAVSAEKCGEIDRAIDAANRAYELNKTSFAAVYTLGRLYSLDPLRCADAVNTLVAALKLKPESADTRVLICNVLGRMSSPAALRYLLQLQKDERFANDPGLHSQLGVIYARSGKLSPALQSFLKAYKADRDNIDVIFNAARFCEFYAKNRRVSRQLYASFESKASGKEAYTAELEEARGAMKN